MLRDGVRAGESVRRKSPPKPSSTFCTRASQHTAYSAGLVSIAAVSASRAFKYCCAATGFDVAFAELDHGRAAERGTFLRGAWLQEQVAEAQSTCVPFVLHSVTGFLPLAPSRWTVC